MTGSPARHPSDWSRTVLGIRASGIVLIGLGIRPLVDGLLFPFTTNFGRMAMEYPGEAIGYWVASYATPLAAVGVGAYLLIRDSRLMLRRGRTGGSHE